MKQALEYYILKMERTYYEKNQTLLGEDVICCGKSGLPCNCFTGLTINYLGYIIRNCFLLDPDVSFDVKDGIKYILTTYDGKRLMPVSTSDSDLDQYLLEKLICNETVKLKNNVYIKIASFTSMEALDKQIENAKGEWTSRITESDVTCEFLLLFLVAIRTQPIEIQSKVLLAMALYIFPNKTAQLIYDFLATTSITEKDREDLLEFMNGYEKFISKLNSCSENGFLSQFSSFFQEFTGVYIGRWIEEIGTKGENDFFHKVLLAASNRNREERMRRSSYFKKIKRQLKETVA